MKATPRPAPVTDDTPLKTFVDRVVVSALVERVIAEQASASTPRAADRKAS